jgi:uncharacterized integral membrane protein
MVEPGADRTDPEDPRRADARHMKRLTRARRARVAKTVLALVIVVGLLVFVLQNAGPVAIRFFFTTAHPKLLWVLVGCVLLGGVAGYLVGRPGKRTKLHDG